MTMKRMLFLLATAAVALVGDPRPSAAREWFPWCAQYADTRNLVECTFMTFEQCRVSVSGIGGSCVQNVRQPPAGGPRPRDRGWQPFYR
jgi:hypothetical protein